MSFDFRVLYVFCFLLEDTWLLLFFFSVIMPPSALDRLGKWGAFDYYSSFYKLFSNFSCTHLTIGWVSLQHLCILSILCFLKSTIRQQNGLHIVVFWSSLQKKAWSICHIGYVEISRILLHFSVYHYVNKANLMYSIRWCKIFFCKREIWCS